MTKSFPLRPIELSNYALPPLDQAWLNGSALKTMLSVLNQNEQRALIVGGAVRNMLFGEKIQDIDIAFKGSPQEIIALAKTAGFKVKMDGAVFGTIRILCQGQYFEITSLREDIITDGRHAKVAFGQDWVKDAQRRDFTINALYMDIEGQIYDPLGNFADILTKKIAFIGDAEQRIQEDYLRILRFFRFFAYYGEGRPERDVLFAIMAHKEKLSFLSKERIWQELKTLLKAPNPMRALRWMRQMGILTLLLPETEKWGIDEVEALIAAENYYHWPIDPYLRLKAMIPPKGQVVLRLSERLGFSKAVAKNFKLWAEITPLLLNVKAENFTKLLYFYDRNALQDGLKLQLAILLRKAFDKNYDFGQCQYQALLEQAENWQKPIFPIKGDDLLKLGYSPSKKMGTMLNRLEELWCQTNFSLTKAQLLEKAQDNLKDL